jgi:hypothetical protein
MLSFSQTTRTDTNPSNRTTASPEKSNLTCSEPSIFNGTPLKFPFRLAPLDPFSGEDLAFLSSPSDFKYTLGCVEIQSDDEESVWKGGEFIDDSLWTDEAYYSFDDVQDGELDGDVVTEIQDDVSIPEAKPAVIEEVAEVCIPLTEEEISFLASCWDVDWLDTAAVEDIELPTAPCSDQLELPASLHDIFEASPLEKTSEAEMSSEELEVIEEKENISPRNGKYFILTSISMSESAGCTRSGRAYLKPFSEKNITAKRPEKICIESRTRSGCIYINARYVSN